MHFLTVKIIIRCIHISYFFQILWQSVSLKIINNYPTLFSKKATNNIALSNKEYTSMN